MPDKCSLSNMEMQLVRYSQFMGAALQLGGPGESWSTQNFGWAWVGHNAFGPTNNWPVCSLILKKISVKIKIGATRCQVLRLKCTKYAFRWLRPMQTPLGELTALPRPLAVLNGPTSKARKGKWRGRERGRKGR